MTEVIDHGSWIIDPRSRLQTPIRLHAYALPRSRNVARTASISSGQVFDAFQ